MTYTATLPSPPGWRTPPLYLHHRDDVHRHSTFTTGMTYTAILPSPPGWRTPPLYLHHRDDVHRHSTFTTGMTYTAILPSPPGWRTPPFYLHHRDDVHVSLNQYHITVFLLRLAMSAPPNARVVKTCHRDRTNSIRTYCSNMPQGQDQLVKTYVLLVLVTRTNDIPVRSPLNQSEPLTSSLKLRYPGNELPESFIY